MEKTPKMKHLALKTILLTLAFFGLSYMMLVFSNRAGTTPYLLVSLSLFFFGLWAFTHAQHIQRHFWRDILGIYSSLALWGFMGEFMENADLFLEHSSVHIAHWNFLPFLLVALFVFLQIRSSLNIAAQFSITTFLLIWLMHFIMIFQYDVFSKTHFSTYILCAVFAVLTGWAVYQTRHSSSIDRKVFWSFFGLLTAWTVLEYIWGWRLIPGPYSI